MSTTNLHYQGAVTITISKTKYRVYNAGTDQLFNVFAKLLAEGSIDKVMLPTYINLFKLDETPQCVLNAPVKVSREYIDGICRISAAITPANLQGSAIGDSGNFELRLFDDASPEKHQLASTKIEFDAVNYIKEGRQALIEWTLSVNNGGST